MPKGTSGFWRACRRFSEYGDSHRMACGYDRENAPGVCKAPEWLQRLSALIGRETIKEKACGLPAAYFGDYRRFQSYG